MIPKIVSAQFEDNNSRNIIDKLFINGNYDEIPNYTIDSLEVAICKTFANKDKNYEQEIYHHLSKYLLVDNAMYHIWGNNSLIYKSYLANPINYTNMVKWYRANAIHKNISKVNEALDILSMGIEDQRIRGLNNSQYFKYLGYDEIYNDRIFTISDSINRIKIYSKYVTWNRLFSETEIGSNLYRTQFLLFAHEANEERRNFYLGLIKDAVIKGYCPIEKEMNFILRTEMMNKGIKKFFEDYEIRIEEIRKEYNKPDYEFSVI